MIIFGTSASVRQGPALPDLCPHCGERSLTGARRFRYFHLFWLPIIPLGSAVSVTCGHCSLSLDGADLEPTTQERARRLTGDVRRPRWHFIGTAIVAGIIAMNAYDDAQLDAMALQAAAAPRVGDVWIVDVQDTWQDTTYRYRYSVGRIDAVHGDEVELNMSDWSYLVSSGANKGARQAIAAQDGDYFVHNKTVSVPQLVAFQASDDFRLLR